MTKDTVYRVQTVELIHCCLKKGVHIRLHLDKPLDLSRLESEHIENKYVVQTTSGGFFRFTLCGIVTITGIPGANTVSSMFAYFRKAEALQCMNRLFPHVVEEYQSLDIDEIEA